MCLFFYLQSLEEDIDAVAADESSAPFIIVSGAPGTETVQYYIACEQTVCLESKAFLDAFLDLIAMYYVYDMDTPNPLRQFCFFFEVFVFKTVDSSVSQPTATAKLIRNLHML